MNRENSGKIRRQLLGIRENHLMELQQRLKQASELGDPGVPDPGDLGSIEDLKDYLHLLGDREREEIMKIDEALTRIDQGTYGACEDCGQQIGDDRLEIQPYTRYCRPCKEKIETREAALRPGQGTI